MLTLVSVVIECQREGAQVVILAKVVLVIDIHLQSFLSILDIEGEYLVPDWIQLLPDIVCLLLLISKC